MALNWDQADRTDPAYDTSDCEERAQVAHDDAEAARREFAGLAARHAAEAIALAAKLGVDPAGSWVKWAQDRKKTFAEFLTEHLNESIVDMFHVPDPDDAYDAAMGK